MLILQNISYIHPQGDLLFDECSLSLHKQDKTALVGHNGSGKSTLLKIAAGILPPASGIRKAGSRPYYLPQLSDQPAAGTIAQALGVAPKLRALGEILKGKVTEEHLALVDDDWGIEERCLQALAYWKAGALDLNRDMSSLSGGQRTKVFLAGISLHNPQIVLLDEPSNHLDRPGRALLYDYIRSTAHTLFVVSHDRTLLNLMQTVYELERHGLRVYGGDYTFYTEQKKTEKEARDQELKSKEKELRKARETERESLERQQKRDARGRKKQKQAGLPTISMNTFRNNAEQSTARIKDLHSGKVAAIAGDLEQIRNAIPDADRIRMDLGGSALHRGKTLVKLKELNFAYTDQLLWQENLNIRIGSGERISLEGLNGSGKTTFIKIILGALRPARGTLEHAGFKAVYLDQDYSLIRRECSVYEQALLFNTAGRLQEHEIKIRLHRFLFSSSSWDKPCMNLSGGEKMRLILCCLMIAHEAPDMIILDEPTNNLDLGNIAILTEALNAYRGTLLVVSHDAFFLQQIGVERSILLG